MIWMKHYDPAYFEWLYSMVGVPGDSNPERSHTLLLDQLIRKDFVWFIPNDDNRFSDGLFLREVFYEDSLGPHDLLNQPCSVLEMLIALAGRMDYQTNKSNDDNIWSCFWLLLDNLGLRKYTDAVYTTYAPAWIDVDDILDTFLHRRYKRNGEGGLFPLKRSRRDQRKIELWYQMSAYILENTNDVD